MSNDDDYVTKHVKHVRQINMSNPCNPYRDIHCSVLRTDFEGFSAELRRRGLTMKDALLHYFNAIVMADASIMKFLDGIAKEKLHEEIKALGGKNPGLKHQVFVYKRKKNALDPTKSLSSNIDVEKIYDMIECTDVDLDEDEHE